MIIKIFWKINSLKFNKEMIIFQSVNSICQFWSFLQIKETTVLKTQRYQNNKNKLKLLKKRIKWNKNTIKNKKKIKIRKMFKLILNCQKKKS